MQLLIWILQHFPDFYEPPLLGAKFAQQESQIGF